jgi:hypothetical protein
MTRFGAVAQLGERLVCNQEATGSIPVSSTRKPVAGCRLWVVGQPPNSKHHSNVGYQMRRPKSLGAEHWVGSNSIPLGRAAER